MVWEFQNRFELFVKIFIYIEAEFAFWFLKTAIKRDRLTKISKITEISKNIRPEVADVCEIEVLNDDEEWVELVEIPQERPEKPKIQKKSTIIFLTNENKSIKWKYVGFFFVMKNFWNPWAIRYVAFSGDQKGVNIWGVNICDDGLYWDNETFSTVFLICTTFS